MVIMFVILFVISYIYPKLFDMLSSLRSYARRKFEFLTYTISHDDFNSEKEKFMEEYNGFLAKTDFTPEDYPAFLYALNKFKDTENYRKYREENV